MQEQEKQEYKEHSLFEEKEQSLFSEKELEPNQNSQNIKSYDEHMEKQIKKRGKVH